MRQANHQLNVVEALPYPFDYCSLVPMFPPCIVEKYHASGGRACVVFGCGPSLEQITPDMWLELGALLTLGVNGVPALAPVAAAAFWPDIWFGIDSIRDQNKPGAYPNIRQLWDEQVPGQKPLRVMSLANASSTDADLYFDRNRAWSLKAGYAKWGRSSVTAGCHWLASVLQPTPKAISLFGVDYSAIGRAGGLPGNSSHELSDKCEQHYADMVDGMAEYGVDIINCSADAKLQAIPRMAWKEFCDAYCDL